MVGGGAVAVTVGCRQTPNRVAAAAALASSSVRRSLSIVRSFVRSFVVRSFVVNVVVVVVVVVSLPFRSLLYAVVTLRCPAVAQTRCIASVVCDRSCNGRWCGMQWCRRGDVLMKAW